MWYPGDSRRDTSIQSCSLEARGLWREMLDLMHYGEPYGHLAVAASGDPVTVTELARLVGVSPQKTRKLLDELRGKNVFSETQTGVIYSRRMVRDEEVRAKRAKGGAKSLENPNVPRPKSERTTDHESQRNGTVEGYPSAHRSPSSLADSSRPSLAVADAVAVAENHKSGNSGTAIPLFEDFRETFYPDPARWADVLGQLNKVRTTGYRFRRKGKPDRMIQATKTRVEEKMREVLASPPRNPNAAIIVLLEKLADPETDGRGRTVTEARAEEETAVFAREAREGREVVARFSTDNPEQYRRIQEHALTEYPSNGPLGGVFRDAWIRTQVLKQVEQLPRSGDEMAT
jgi:hypothetical protein